MEKIAIKGDAKNGRKIIEYFESIGEKKFRWFGNDKTLYYHINSYNVVDARDYPPKGYTIYESWNEFEKNYLNKNKMEKRNIEISLEKAKEWYKQGGDLREVALQAFSEDELIDKFPSSWSEFLYSKECRYCSINNFLTEDELKAMYALTKLIQLRDEYWELDDKWKPIHSLSETKYCIYPFCNNIICDKSYCIHFVLTFRTEELRDKFYNNFKDLIEQAKMFL